MEQQIQEFFNKRRHKTEVAYYTKNVERFLDKNLQIKLLCEDPWYLNQVCLVFNDYDLNNSAISITLLLEEFLLHHLYRDQKKGSNNDLTRLYILQKYSAQVNFLERLAFKAEMANTRYISLPADADPNIVNDCLRLNQIYPEKGMFNNLKNFYFPQSLIQQYYTANYIAKHCDEMDLISFLDSHAKEFWHLTVAALARANRESELRLIFETLIKKFSNNEMTTLDILLKCYNELYADPYISLNTIIIFEDVIEISINKLNTILDQKILNQESKIFLHSLSQLPYTLDSMDIDKIFINYLEEKNPDLTNKIWTIISKINYFTPLLLHVILNHFNQLGVFQLSTNSNLRDYKQPLDMLIKLYYHFNELMFQTLLNKSSLAESKILMIRAYLIGSQSEWIQTDVILKWLYLTLKYQHSEPPSIWLNEQTMAKLQTMVTNFKKFNNYERFLKAIEKFIPHIPLLIYAKDDTAIQHVIDALTHGADINARDEQGRTALHIACIADAYEVVQTLLARGIDYTLRDYKGRTAYLILRELGRAAILEYLDEKIVDPTEKEKISTPIEFNISTTKNGWPQLFSHLIEQSEPSNKNVIKSSSGLRK